ncbi:hypothetical protein ACTFIZ_000254, partial [Dictyostelium cf. discoideum]
DYKD